MDKKLWAPIKEKCEKFCKSCRSEITDEWIDELINKVYCAILVEEGLEPKGCKNDR